MYASVDGYPAWAPDGSSIAYRRAVFSSQGPPGIYLVNRDGTGNRLLLDETPFYSQGFVLLQEIRFSPNGLQLSWTKDRELFLLDVKSGALKQLTHTDQNATHPDWSPDGRYIVYKRPFFRSVELDSSGFYIIEVSSGTERALFANGKRITGSNLRWSPQGEPIAFDSTRDGYPNIHTLRSDGTELRRLTQSANRAWSEIPHWIENGTQILYAWRLATDPGSLQTRVMNLNGDSHRIWPLTLSELTLQSDAISPDSREVVVPDLPPNSPDSLAVLFIRGLDDVEGTTLRQLTSYSPPPDTTATPHVEPGKE
jgi:Tol biopolymer transport system component